MEKKYELTDETIKVCGHVLHRIKSLRSFDDVKKGDLGGFIEKEENLSHEDDCWVYGNAKVYGDAEVFDNAQIFGYAKVYDNANVCDNAKVYGNAAVHGDAKVYGHSIVKGNAEICGDAVVKEMGDYMVFKNTWSSGRYFTWTRSNNMWRVGCFYGTGDELIKKAYTDNERKGKYYESYVKSVENLVKIG